MRQGTCLLKGVQEANADKGCFSRLARWPTSYNQSGMSRADKSSLAGTERSQPLQGHAAPGTITHSSGASDQEVMHFTSNLWRQKGCWAGMPAKHKCRFSTRANMERNQLLQDNVAPGNDKASVNQNWKPSCISKSSGGMLAK